ncbi:MAG: T9SS type A sorting domain-containing protein, partial [Bacteroidota bacterium]|nr:T9SS type A sorting domain-containing protein [Bacteroidota bacterium]
AQLAYEQAENKLKQAQAAQTTGTINAKTALNTSKSKGTNAQTTYNVTITQSNGCTSSASKVVVVNPKPVANAGSDITIVQGESANLYANAGSNTSFGFKWINMNKYDSILGQKVIVSPTVTSTYTLFVKSENGCTSTDGIVINVVGKLVVTAGDNKSICVGGSATLKAEGGTMFKWSDAANSTTSSIVVSPSITTTYTVTAFDGFQSATNIVTVFVNNLKVNAGQNQNICKSAQATLNAYAEGAAGTQISFVWNTGEKTATIKVAPTSSATYSVTVTSGGCSASNNVTVNVSDIVANAGMNQTICNGQSANLTATGGTTYKWNTGASNTGASVLVSPTTTTTYTVTVGSGNCSAVSSVIVSVKDKIVASAGANQTICSGQAARLAATGGELYKWSTNDLQANIAVTPATTTTYTVTTSKNGCYETSDVVIFVNPSIKVSINGGIAICKGGIVDLYAQTLNNPNINFQWSTGETSQKLTVSPTATATYFITATLGTCTATNNTVVIVNEAVPASAGPNKTINSESTVQLTASGGDYYIWNLGLQKQTISVTPTITTTYTVTVRNIAGCSATANTVVIVNAPPVANAGSDLTICLLKTCTLNAIGGKYYQWSTGSRQQQIVVNPTSTTTYTVTVTNSTGAKNTDQVIVTVNFATANAGPDKTVCKGQSVTLSGSGSGGTFKWNTGETTSSIVVTPLSMKIYSLVVTNGSCSATDNVIVRVGNMGVNAGPDRTVCKGSAINIIAIASANSNPSFKWSNGGNTADITAKVGVTTSYTVTATSNAGCSATDQVVITVITCKNNDDFDISNTTASVNNNKISTDNGLNLSVYPNPGNGIYNFEAKIAGNSSVRLKVLNILGVKVYETTIKNDSGIFRKNLNLTNLPNGLYMLVVETDAQKVVRNFIKN